MAVFESIYQLSPEKLHTFLDGLEDCVVLDEPILDSAYDSIRFCLSKSQHRPLGLILLQKFIKHLRPEQIEPHYEIWINLVLKSHQKEWNSDAYQILTLLARKGCESQNLFKSFSNHVNKIYSSLALAPVAAHLSALLCIEQCLRLYSIPNRSLKEIENFLSSFDNSQDQKKVICSGVCQLFLYVSRGGKAKSQENLWQEYQVQLLKNLHEILSGSLKFLQSPSKLNVGDVSNAADSYILFGNNVTYLEVALREPLQFKKNMLPEKVLQLIKYGLDVMCQVILNDSVELMVKSLIPKFQSELLHLLQTLIIILQSQLKIYSNLCLEILCSALRSVSGTITKSSPNHQILLSGLRSQIYDIITLWCFVMKNGSCCETFGKLLIQEITTDIFPNRKEMTLKVSKTLQTNKHKNYMSLGTEQVGSNEFLSQRQALCIKALQCCQAIIRAASFFLEPVVLKSIQTVCFHICSILCEKSYEPWDLYTNPICRVEIYKLLEELLLSSTHICTSSTELIFHTLTTAYCCEQNVQVKFVCQSILQNLEACIHPRKESLYFSEKTKISPDDIFGEASVILEENASDDFNENVLTMTREFHSDTLCKDTNNDDGSFANPEECNKQRTDDQIVLNSDKHPDFKTSASVIESRQEEVSVDLSESQISMARQHAEESNDDVTRINLAEIQKQQEERDKTILRKNGSPCFDDLVHDIEVDFVDELGQ